jgi:hypothetical protein
MLLKLIFFVHPNSSIKDRKCQPKNLIFFNNFEKKVNIFSKTKKRRFLSIFFVFLTKKLCLLC